jgi:hypothetical protein
VASTRGPYWARAATPSGAVPAQDAVQQGQVRVMIRYSVTYGGGDGAMSLT